MKTSGITRLANSLRQIGIGTVSAAIALLAGPSQGSVTNSGGIVTIQADNKGAADVFGHVVAVSSNGLTLAIGAPGEDSATVGIRSTASLDNRAANSGAVYVYTRTALTSPWIFQAYVKAPLSQTSRANSLFGFAVSLSANGTVMAVGAPGENNSKGAVYVYRYQNIAWTYSDERATCADSDLECGAAVALSGNGFSMLVGAPKGNSESGAAYLFTQDFNGCLGCSSNAQVAFRPYAILPSGGDYTGAHFGASVAINYDASAVAIGAPDASYVVNHDVGPPDYYYHVGLAYVVKNMIVGPWDKRTIYPPSPTRSSNALFGFSVALPRGSNSLAIGSPGDNNLQGAVHTYLASTSGWAYSQKLVPASSEAGDNFGYSLSFTADGLALLIGAPFEDSMAVGINGDETNNLAVDAGAAYVFWYISSSRRWEPRGYFKASDTFAGDHYGGSVAVAGDGLTIAVGAPTKGANVGSAGAGAAYVY